MATTDQTTTTDIDKHVSTLFERWQAGEMVNVTRDILKDTRAARVAIKLYVLLNDEVCQEEAEKLVLALEFAEQMAP